MLDIQSCLKKKLDAQPIHEETRERQAVEKVVDIYVTEAWLYEQAHHG